MDNIEQTTTPSEAQKVHETPEVYLSIGIGDEYVKFTGIFDFGDSDTWILSSPNIEGFDFLRDQLLPMLIKEKEKEKEKAKSPTPPVDGTTTALTESVDTSSSAMHRYETEHVKFQARKNSPASHFLNKFLNMMAVFEGRKQATNEAHLMEYKMNQFGSFVDLIQKQLTHEAISSSECTMEMLHSWVTERVVSIPRFEDFWVDMIDLDMRNWTTTMLVGYIVNNATLLVRDMFAIAAVISSISRDGRYAMTFDRDSAGGQIMYFVCDGPGNIGLTVAIPCQKYEAIYGQGYHKGVAIGYRKQCVLVRASSEELDQVRTFTL